MSTRPTIAELEAILRDTPNGSVGILPSGELRFLKNDPRISLLEAECDSLRAEVERLKAEHDAFIQREHAPLFIRAVFENKRLKEALKEIQHANGSPNDEDFVTTRAREALRAPESDP